MILVVSNDFVRSYKTYNFRLGIEHRFDKYKTRLALITPTSHCAMTSKTFISNFGGSAKACFANTALNELFVLSCLALMTSIHFLPPRIAGSLALLLADTAESVLFPGLGLSMISAITSKTFTSNFGFEIRLLIAHGWRPTSEAPTELQIAALEVKSGPL